MKRLLLVLYLGFVAAPAWADEGRFQDYAVGARAMGLGGAYAAIADDASGIFYNPAGLTDVTHARLNLSTNLYGVELNGTTPIESAVLRFESGLSAADFIILPSSTGVAMGLGRPLPGGGHRHAVAFGTQVPQYTSRLVESFERDPATGRTTRFLSSLTDRTLHAGAGYAFRAGPWIRVGFAAHYLLRTVDAQESLISRQDDDARVFFLSENRLRSTYHSVRGVVGLKVRPGPRLTLGASLTTPTLGLWRTASYESAEAAGAPDGPAPALDLVRVDHADVDLSSQLPAQLRLGVAFVEPADFALSADVIAYAPSAYEVVPAEALTGVESRVRQIPIPLKVERGPLVNGAVGFEKLLSDELSVAVGLFTNFTSAPELDYDEVTGVLRAGSSRLSRVHMIGGSFALGFFSEHSLSRLGVTGSTGWGKAVLPTAPADRLGTRANALRAVDATQTYLYVFWSSSFRWGEGRGERDFSL